MELRSFNHRHAAVACALSFVLSVGAGTPALAAGNDSIAPLNASGDLMASVEETTRVYQEAETALQNLNAQIAENEAKAAEIQTRLPEQRARAAASIRTLYKFQQNTPGLLDLICSAEDFNDFVSTLHYIDSITERNTAEIRALSDLQDELVQTQASLVAERDAAVTRQENARVALEAARNTRMALAHHADDVAAREADARAQAIAAAQSIVDGAALTTAAAPASGLSVSVANQQDAQTRDQAEQPANAQNDAAANQTTNNQAATPAETPAPETPAAQQPAAQPAAQPAQQPAEQPTTPAPTPEPAPEPAAPEPAAPEATFTTASGNTATVEVAPEASPSTDPIVNNTTSDEVSEWATRINNYLEGTALEGYGQQFAQAASDYGVDPRIAPAISGVESGWGQVTFKDHNAWGWGSQSWSDWDTAINDYVEGYSDIYGSTVTLEGAEMYASNDIYDVWYSTVLSEMDKI